jgi:hypothetical protein
VSFGANFEEMDMSKLNVIRSAAGATLFSGFLTLGGAGLAHAQSTATATANATGTIIEGLSIVKVTDLDFGDNIAGATPGTITLTPVNFGNSIPTVSVTGGVTHLPGETNALFSVFGESGRFVNVTLPATPLTITSPNSDTMVVRDFITNAGVNPSFELLPPNGHRGFGVGATLDVAANQPTGTYSNTFDVTVSYQ